MNTVGVPSRSVLFRRALPGLGAQIVGIALFLAGISKAAAPSDAMQSVAHLLPVSPGSALTIVGAVVAAEIVLGSMLITRIGVMLASRITIVLLLIFSAFLGLLIATDSPFACGCGGRLFMWTPPEAHHELGIARNLILSALLIATPSVRLNPTPQNLW